MHLYLLHTWNLVCRANGTASLTFNRIWVEVDCLSIAFGVEKCKQGGDEGNECMGTGTGKHVYAHPISPADCPILALAFYLICQWTTADPETDTVTRV